MNSRKKSTIMLASALCIATLSIGVVWYIIAPPTLQIDESWWIVHNDSDQYDSVTVNFIKDEYGSELKSIHTTNTSELNSEGQSLLFIGGSDALAGKVPWIDPNRPGLTVIKPLEQPDVYWYSDGTYDNIWIHTPKGDFDIQEDGVLLHDYGLITRVYDTNLKKWVIITIGFSAECTGAGARILIEDLSLVKEHSWIIYEYIGSSVPLDDWSIDVFDYVIVEWS